jgi:hypothetical protein
MNSWRRMGSFLIGLGVFLLALFVISDSVRQAEFGLLASGALAVGLGIFLLMTHPKPEPPKAPRFRLVRGIKDEPQPKKEVKPPAPPKGPAGGKPGPGGPPAGKGGPPPKGGGAPGKGGPPPKGGKPTGKK